jgi:hypothetical protein
MGVLSSKMLDTARFPQAARIDLNGVTRTSKVVTNLSAELDLGAMIVAHNIRNETDS